ncbi:MAG: integrase catalytic domain-containing protein [Propionibacteriaceae bacterium]
MPQEPWEYLAMDFNSPSSLGVKLLVVTDYFSRYIAVTIMKETDVVRVEDQLEDLFDTYGYPVCLRADNGPPFSSKELSTEMTKAGSDVEGARERDRFTKYVTGIKINGK